MSNVNKRDGVGGLLERADYLAATNTFLRKKGIECYVDEPFLKPATGFDPGTGAGVVDAVNLSFHLPIGDYYLLCFGPKDGFSVEEYIVSDNGTDVVFFKIWLDLTVEVTCAYLEDGSGYESMRFKANSIDEVFEVAELIFSFDDKELPSRKLVNLALDKVVESCDAHLNYNFDHPVYCSQESAQAEDVKSFQYWWKVNHPDEVVDYEGLGGLDDKIWIDEIEKRLIPLNSMVEDLQNWARGKSDIIYHVEFPHSLPPRLILDLSTSRVYYPDQVVGLSQFFHWHMTPKDPHSLMYFYDLMNSADFSTVMRSFKSGDHFLSLKKTFRSTRVEIIPTRKGQILDSLERRCMQYEFENKVKEIQRSISNASVARMSSAYWTRASLLSRLDEDMVRKIYEDENILPVWLDAPYRKFMKIKKHEDKARLAEITLSSVLRTCVGIMLLPYESAQNCRGEHLSNVRKQLCSKPASDGSLLEFLSKLTEGTNVEGGPLSVLGKKLHSIQKNLRGLVEARNRRHHAPFDTHRFIEAAISEIPSVVDALRQGFDGMQFAIISHSKVTSSGNEVTGIDLRSVDGFASERTWATDHGLEQFLYDVPIIFSDQLSPTRIDEFFRIGISGQSTNSIKAAIFDRPKDGEFTFVEVEI